MSERKLATIRRVSEIFPIDGADKIELARIDGWQCVVKKDEFKVSDLAVYFEVDSFLPCEEPFLFLEPKGRKRHNDGSEGFRLRTIKLRGQLSQGLLLPMKYFFTETNVTEGADVTDILGVKVYEMPINPNLYGKVKGSFPEFIKKTDQERIQNLPYYWTKCKGVKFEATEKMDGTSSTYYLNEDKFGICSRNLEKIVDYENDDSTYTKVAIQCNTEEAMRKIGKNVAIQGEICGPGIQKNRAGLNGLRFFMFDIWDIKNRCYFSYEEKYDYFNEMMVNGAKICHVPIIEEAISIFDVCPTMNDILEYVKGKSVYNPQSEREGIVFKSRKKIDGEIISFKVINNDYLLAYE